MVSHFVGTAAGRDAPILVIGGAVAAAEVGPGERTRPATASIAAGARR